MNVGKVQAVGNSGSSDYQKGGSPMQQSYKNGHKHTNFKDVLTQKMKEEEAKPKKQAVLIYRDGTSRAVATVPAGAVLIKTTVQFDIYKY